MLTFTHEAMRQDPRIRRVWDLYEVGLAPCILNLWPWQARPLTTFSTKDQTYGKPLPFDPRR